MCFINTGRGMAKHLEVKYDILSLISDCLRKEMYMRMCVCGNRDGTGMVIH